MSNLDKIYQQTIMDYNQRQDLKGEIENPTYVERGHNPSCGDDLTLLLRIKDNIIEQASFIGVGCAISTASTAMLIEDIRGKSIEEVKAIIAAFFDMMRNDVEPNDELLNDAVLLKFAANMPARVKCATLSWHSLKVVLDKKK